MRFEFGPFVLDEPGRALRLANSDVSLQPLVFDLLVYLINNRSRVVSKDELLDALWPGITVTENSLQRAVSTLRGALRQGGMDAAVRNFPRAGYRICFDFEDRDAAPRANTSSGNDATRAFIEQRWTDAVALFSEVDATGTLKADDLVKWAFALQCLGRPSEAIPLSVRATAAYTQMGNNDAAAESAVALSTIHLERGESSVAMGWLARAQDLIAAVPETTMTGQIMWMQARFAANEGDPQAALKLADAAYNFGRRRHDIRIEALGLMYRGFYRLSLGETSSGLADQDHAAALALSNQIDPITGGVLYCNILWACRTFGDWARASQWTLGYQKFCSDNQMGFSGSCQLHRAEVLGIHGTLDEAATRINAAIDQLSGDAPWALGDAHRVLGDIYAAKGNSSAALAAYDKCYAMGWSPEPGHAMLLLERGDPEAAYASIERSLIGQSWWTLQRQGILLAHLALIAAHAGRAERAQALIDDLAGQNDRWPMPSIRALTNEASAILALRQGDANEALQRLHLARQLWTSIDSQINAARLRLEIAALQLDIGDRASAGAEIHAASVTAAELDSEKIRNRCMTLMQMLPLDAIATNGSPLLREADFR